MNYEEKLDKKLLLITEMFYGSDNERAFFYALGMRETLAPILLELHAALNNWIIHEREVIKKEGPYAFDTLPNLINKGEEALKKFEDFIK